MSENETVHVVMVTHHSNEPHADRPSPVEAFADEADAEAEAERRRGRGTSARVAPVAFND